MGKQTTIEWADGGTWNFLRGCLRTSTGCENCYAERQAIRGKNGPYKDLVRSTPNGPRWTGKIGVAWDHMDDPLHWPQRGKTRAHIFVNSMSDFFYKDVPQEALDAAWKVMRKADWHDFLILTKRPENIMDRLPADWGTGYPNVWLGVSAEDQNNADARIPRLLEVRAAVRWVSVEPLLGPINLKAYLVPSSSLTWVVCGGESGPGARPCDVRWLESLVDQCKREGIAVFTKQLGAKPYRSPERDGATGYELPITDRKGGDINEFPETLRVREFPKVVP